MSASGDYHELLRSKVIADQASGFVASDLLPALFPFQAAIVRWGLRRGRAAIFADCGMGKTLMQLEWARRVADHSGGRVLVVAPLAVAQQTVREADKFGLCADYDRLGSSRSEVVVTNYEMLEKFSARDFSGVVIDESSILKSFDGATRNLIVEMFRATPYRLACTATPSPNDYVELGNHAEFLGAMSRVEMLATFFVHDGGDTSEWRLKGHAEDAFWQWVASWGCMLRFPSDIGFDDDGFVLPPIERHSHVVQSNAKKGWLFAMEAGDLQERIAARRSSVAERVGECARLVAQCPAEPWVIWCNLNSESEALAAAIPGAVEVRGSMSNDEKEAALLGFANGSIRVLVTKPSIAGFGMNWQHCSRMAFVGLSDSWEQMYQATRRCWRFGQLRPVHVHIVTAESEGSVLRNVMEKERDAARMADGLVKHCSTFVREELGLQRRRDHYMTSRSAGKGWEMVLGDCVEQVEAMPDQSIDFSVFSPPFASLYTYSASERDMGNCKDRTAFFDHFAFLVRLLVRKLKPGRLCSVHCMNLPTSKTFDGVIGLYDFRGEIIRQFVDVGFIYHSEVCIWKDPVTAMQRTKALGLLYKQIKKDSSMSRMGIPDYVVTFRVPGENADPIVHDPSDLPVSEWQRIASPVWMDINPSDTLQHRSVREEKDEKHICPLQLDVIRRCLRLWSNPGDLVLSPFAGIGSEGFAALELGRRFVGVELKETYYKQACANLAAVRRQGTLFSPDEVSAEVA